MRSRAVVMRETGAPEVLVLEERELAPLAAGDVRLRTLAAAVGVSDLRVGDRAWTMMQGLGGVRAERDGGYAEHVTVAASAVAPLPAGVDPVAFAAYGLAAVTAAEGMERLGSLAGTTLRVTGPTGGGGDVRFDAWSLRDGLVLTGYSTEDLDGPAPRRATRRLLDLALEPLPCEVMRLEDAALAHARLERREVRGRVVLRP